MAKTQHTLREILQRLHVIGIERPDDQPIIMDVINIISHHVSIVDKLARIQPQAGPRIETIATVDDILYSSKISKA